ncbi:MAG: cytochrome P450 [Actinobacteria bacterium]|nr:cytochrome P450 [Actinomycetota bacterium]MSZ03454.1 cytochrome P450 [Actinomycetota bacterium]MTB06230.1 cytochrome P450 [Actinomycetota bacterium]
MVSGIVDWVDLKAADTYANGHPWDAYARLRNESPVAWHPESDGPGFWALSKWADVRTVSRQPQRFSSYRRGVMMEEIDEAQLGAQRLMMLNMDPPQHDRFKLLVSRGFTPKAAAGLVPRIHDLAREIVDDVIGRGEGDFVADLAGRLPSGLIAEFMGIPRSDGEHLYELTEIMHTTDETIAPPERKMAAIGEMLGYAAGVAQSKRRNPGEDIGTALVQAEVDGVSLTDEEFQWFFLLLVNAGGDTTRNLVAAGMQLLFEHPDQRARLTADLDGLMGSAIEEMLRYTTPVIYFRRTLTEDTEIRDVPMRAGDKVVMLYGSVNRDEEVFEDADRFDVGRTPNPHMAFGGGGPHLCLGMHVARIEIDAMFRQILTRMPDLRPAGERHLMASNFIAGVHSMPVQWTPGGVS